MTATTELSTHEKRWIAHDIIKEELEAAVQKLSDIALSSGIKLDDSEGLDFSDKEMWEAMKHTRASLAIKFVNAWHLVYDAFEPDDCPDDC